MTERHVRLSSPVRVVGTALVVILLFALLYPFAGGFTETVSQTGVGVTYVLEPSGFSEPRHAANVLGKSLDYSVQRFTLVGSSDTEPLGTARYLAYLESLSGMAFVALLTASLVRET